MKLEFFVWFMVGTGGEPGSFAFKQVDIHLVKPFLVRKYDYGDSFVC